MLPHSVKETRAFSFNRIIEDGENCELNQNVEDGKNWVLNEVMRVLYNFMRYHILVLFFAWLFSSCLVMLSATIG